MLVILDNLLDLEGLLEVRYLEEIKGALLERQDLLASYNSTPTNCLGQDLSLRVLRNTA